MTTTGSARRKASNQNTVPPHKRRATSSSSTPHRNNGASRPTLDSVRNQYDLIASHLNARGLARLGAASKSGIGQVARTELRVQLKKILIDYFSPRFDSMQHFVRDVAVKVTENPWMSLSRIHRVIKEHHIPYKGLFDLTIERDSTHLYATMQTKITNPTGGPGFMGMSFEFTLAGPLLNPQRHMRMHDDFQFRVATPAVTDSLTLKCQRGGFTLRDLRPWTWPGEIDFGATVHVKNKRKSRLAPAHLVTRYTDLGETKWCRTAFTDTQALDAVDEVSIGRGQFVELRVMLEVIKTILGVQVASAIQRHLVTTMQNVQREACQIIRAQNARARV